jgi:hypothetical protein
MTSLRAGRENDLNAGTASRRKLGHADPRRVQHIVSLPFPRIRNLKRNFAITVFAIGPHADNLRDGVDAASLAGAVATPERARRKM